MAPRKSAQEVANENLAIAQRVHEKAEARVVKTKEAHDKAVADEKFARRKVTAAEMLASDDEPEPSIDADVTPADGTPDDASDDDLV